MLEALRFGDWSALNLQPLEEAVRDQPIYLALLFPVLIALVSRSLPAIAGALGLSALAVASALSGWTDAQRVVLAGTLELAAALFALSGFGQRRLAQRVRATELKLVELERRLTEGHERELLKAVRRRSPDMPQAAEVPPPGPATSQSNTPQGLELRPYPGHRR
jgi:hypothetical protein